MKNLLSKSSQSGESELTVLIILASAAAWITHLYVCFTAGKWGFLIAGAIFFPVAIVHGIGVWFGAW
jgi:hypothetical protein